METFHKEQMNKNSFSSVVYVFLAKYSLRRCPWHVWNVDQIFIRSHPRSSYSRFLFARPFRVNWNFNDSAYGDVGKGWWPRQNIESKRKGAEELVTRPLKIRLWDRNAARSFLSQAATPASTRPLTVVHKPGVTRLKNIRKKYLHFAIILAITRLKNFM